MSTVEDMAQAAKLAYGDVPQAAYNTGKGVYQRAQNAGMHILNWRFKGASDEAANAPATTTAAPAKPRGTNWTTESTDESTTYYHHTKSTRKEHR